MKAPVLSQLANRVYILSRIPNLSQGIAAIARKNQHEQRRGSCRQDHVAHQVIN